MAKLPDLLIDILQEDPLWKSSHSIIHDYFSEHVTSYVRELENVRNIDHNTPQQIVEESIRQIGFDIPAWLMKANGTNIRRSFYQLSQYYQIVGTKNYPKFIQFLLGRGLTVTTLYTEDYSSFYPQPLGKLKHEGGTWFSTPHVDLDIVANGLFDQYELSLNQSDISFIQKELDYDNQPIWRKNEIDAHIREMVDKGSIYGVNDALYAYMIIERRIIEIFYKFAPIEEVVRAIFISIRSSADLYLSMFALNDQTDYVILDAPYPDQVFLELHSMLSASQEYPVYARVVWSNGAQSVERATITSADHDYSVQNAMPYDLVIFDEVQTLRKDVTINFTTLEGYGGSAIVTIYQGGVELVPANIKLSGSNVLKEATTYRYKVIGDFRGPQGDTKLREISDVENITLFSNSPDITIDKLTVTVNRIFADTMAVIQAKYVTSELTELFTDLTIQLQAIPKPVVPVSIAFSYTRVVRDAVGTIISEDPHTGDFIQGQYYKIKTTVAYSDGNSSLQDCEITTNTGFVYVESDRVFYATPVYRDFEIKFTARLMDEVKENLELVVGTTTAQIIYPKILMLGIDIIGPDSVVEGSTAQYTAMARWSNTQTSSIPESEWDSVDTVVGTETLYAIPVTQDGVVSAPLLGSTRRSKIRVRAKRYTDGAWVIGEKIIDVLNRTRLIQDIRIQSGQDLKESFELPVQFFTEWNDTKLTQVIPNLVQLRDPQTGGVIASVIRTDSNSDDIILTSAHNAVEFYLSTSEFFKETDSGLTLPVLMLKYAATENKIGGIFELVAEYNQIGVANTVKQNKLIILSPRVIRVESVAIDIPDKIPEGSRYFARARATYEDGNIVDVDAEWRVSAPDPDETDLGADLSKGKFLLSDIIKALTGVTPENIMDLALSGQELSSENINKILNGEPMFRLAENLPSVTQTWPQKLAILYAAYPDPLPRCVVQSRYIQEDEQIVLNCIFFAVRDQKVVTIINKPTVPITPIKNWYMDGPVEIDANLFSFYSYGLMVQYDDNGLEYYVSNDWSVELYKDDTFDQRREIIRGIVLRDGDDILPMDSDGSGTRKTVNELTEEEMLEIMPTNAVVDIDQNGYLYPRINEDMRIVVTADFNDGYSRIIESLPVYVRRQNTRLKKITIALVDPVGNITFDFKDKLIDAPNSWANISLTGVVYYQFKAFLERVENPDPVELIYDVFWKAEPVGVGVSFDEQTGKLYILPQADDSDVTIVAGYEEEFRESETSSSVFLEKITSRSLARIEATTAIDIVEMIGSLFANSESTYYPNARVVRRDGTIADRSKVLKWALVSSPLPTIQLTEDEQGFVLPSLVNDSSMIIRAIATEGTREITRDFSVSILASFVPIELHVDSNPLGMRDNSQIFLKAFAEIRDSASFVDVANQCYWLLDTKVTGLTLDNRSGLLVIPNMDRDTEINIRVVYKFNELTFEKSLTILAQSSYPMYWTHADTVLNANFLQVSLEDSKSKRLLSKNGGRFTVNPNANEYMHFAYPKYMGTAKFAIIPSTTGATDWGTANTPTEVTRTYMDGSSEAWYIYRSSKRGFTLAEFSVVYAQ